jgi:diguanylate cyclase (GGDEF)-like protein/PAS domain S-box-containing protein
VRYRPIIMLIVSGIALIAAIVIGTAITILNLRDSALVGSERELANTALLIAKHADHEIEELDAVQNSLIEEMRSLGNVSSEDFERKMSGVDVHSMLKHKISGLSHIGSVALINSDGMLTNTSLEWPFPAINAADRNYFKAFKSDAQLTSFVSEPIRGRRTGNWTIVFARKITAPNGEFLGVVRGTIDLQYFENFFESVILGEGGSISLFRNDGTLLVRYPRIEPTIGHVFKGAIDVRQRGTTRLVGKMDGKDRLLAAQRLEHFPLFISVGVDVAAALANWQKEVIVLVGLGGLAALMIAAMVFIIARQLLRGKKRFQHEFDEQKLQLNTAFSNMSQGLVMFNSAARLVVCNDRYRQIYNLPPDLTTPGCSVVDLLKHRAANGTFFGNPEEYVGDLLATIAQGKIAKQEVETGDGRIISVVNQPMAGGGWVATHEDITEAKQQEATLRLLFKSNPVPMWVYALDNLRFLAVNEAAVAHYGYSREQFMAMKVLDISPVEERERFAQLARMDGGYHDGEQIRRHQKSDGTKIDVAIYSRALSYGGYTAGLVAAIDVTERKRAEDELRRTQTFFNTIIENVPLPIVVKSVPSAVEDASECRFTLINRAAEKIFGVSRDKMIGKNAREFYSRDQADFVVRYDNEALRADHPILVGDDTIKTSNTDIRNVTARKVAIRDDDGKPKYLLSLLEDVTERRRTEQHIVHMAHYDNLTDLPNRATFNECLAATLDRVARSGEQFGILSIDLDRFKEANDAYGHAVGDALLREVARRLQAAAAGAFLGRIGGDEFTLIVTDGAQPAAAAALAERLLAAFVDDFEVEGHRLKLGLSIGGAIYPTDGTDAKTLIINADIALYRAKAEARESVLFFEPQMSARLHERRTLEEDLRSALERDELLLHYQPQKKMSGETVGFEALVRWQCPKRGMVSPGVFIPIAEESDLIVRIGEWVLREACREAASWPQPLTIAVNISPIQFRQGDLPRLVLSVLLETGLAPARLELEITESVLIDDFSRAVSILTRLKSLGVRIALDDFGTGYSSLSYLHSFSFDKIKIDRIFIGDLEHSRQSMAIVRAVMGLGHSLGVPILAEGVETDAQYASLVEEGCDEVQGYLTGRPLPIADYAKLVGREAITQQNHAAAG